MATILISALTSSYRSTSIRAASSLAISDGTVIRRTKKATGNVMKGAAVTKTRVNNVPFGIAAPSANQIAAEINAWARTAITALAQVSILTSFAASLAERLRTRTQY